MTDTSAIRELHIQTARGAVYVEDIPGAGPAAVLMHGFPDDHRIYNRLVRHLAPCRVVAFDWLGYGKSERVPEARLTPAGHEAELGTVLDELEIASAVLVAHDAAGPDAIRYTLRSPQRVARLVLLDTYFGRQPALRFPEMIKLLADPALRPLADAMISDETQRLWLLQHTAARFEQDPLDPRGIGITSVLPQFFGDAAQPDALTAIRAWTGGLFQALDEQDAIVRSSGLRHLDVPVAVITGDRDHYLSPALAAQLAELFPNGSHHVVVGASHWPQHDHPEVLAELIRGRPD